MKFKITLITLFFFLHGFSQKTLWDTNIDVISTTKGIFAYSSIGINFNKIKVQSGILIGKEFVNRESVLGVQADVLYFPNSVSKKIFNFFFIGSINYFSNKVSINTSEVKTNFIQVTLGYGFNYFISERLLLRSYAGVGTILENRKFNFNTSDPTNKWGSAGIISIGFTYKL